MKLYLLLSLVAALVPALAQEDDDVEVLSSQGQPTTDGEYTNTYSDHFGPVYSMQQGGYGSINEAIYYAPYIGAAICPVQSIKAWSCSFCRKLSGAAFQATVQDPRFDTFGIVTTDYTRQEIVLSFRGASNLNNWVQALKVLQTDFPGVAYAKVHSGIKECSDGLANRYLFQIKRLLQQPAFNQFNVVVTGHSLGGAIAVLAALRIQSALGLRWSRLKVFTYGEPRIGNAYFANYVNSLPLYIIRVVNENDLIPHLPPSSLDYVHHHTELYIGNGVPRLCSRQASEDPSCSVSRLDISIQAHNDFFGNSIRIEAC
ncbi:hypothetical protein DSO57_1035718 [Entomophthora muscae]|uniref:Uncharacterized protein n=1 Tax=Entomophthora muscae TaxID=34485 RepID=A0ACC2RQG4_9FUNG|nr:hypothetical protein DSO57_1035718 [Entomophthora muscae]